MLKKNKENIFIFVLLILLILVFVVIVILKTMNRDDQKEENTYYSYVCKQEQKDIQFAVYDTYYYFDEENGEIKNPFQVYNFMFTNLDYYNTIDQSALFKDNQPHDVVEDKNNLVKSYYFNSPIPFENNDNTNYIQLVEKLGYTCEKTDSTNETS